MINGAKAEAQRKDILKAGMPVPRSLYPPPIIAGYEPWYEAFLELSTDRQVGMGTGPIPSSSIRDHVRGWGEEDADFFRRVIRAMDDAYLTIIADKEKAAQKK